MLVSDSIPCGGCSRYCHSRCRKHKTAVLLTPCAQGASVNATHVTWILQHVGKTRYYALFGRAMCVWVQRVVSFPRFEFKLVARLDWDLRPSRFPRPRLVLCSTVHEGLTPITLNATDAPSRPRLGNHEQYASSHPRSRPCFRVFPIFGFRHSPYHSSNFATASP